MKRISKLSDVNDLLTTTKNLPLSSLPERVSFDAAPWAVATRSQSVCRLVLGQRAGDADLPWPALPRDTPVTFSKWCEHPGRRAELAVYLVSILSTVALLLSHGIEPIVALEGQGREQPAGGNKPLALCKQQLNKVVALVLKRLGVRSVLTTQTGDASAIAGLDGQARKVVITCDAVDLLAHRADEVVTLEAPRLGAVQQGILRGLPTGVTCNVTTAPNATYLRVAAVIQSGEEDAQGTAPASYANCASGLVPPICPPRGAAAGTVERRRAAVRAIVRALRATAASATAASDPVARVCAMLAPGAQAPPPPSSMMHPLASPETCLAILAASYALKTADAKARALRLADELDGGVAAARAELAAAPAQETRHIKAPAAAAILKLCGWDEAAAQKGGALLSRASGAFFEARREASPPSPKRARVVAAPPASSKGIIDLTADD